MIMAEACLPSPKVQMCRAGTARRYLCLQIMKRPVAQAFSLGARTGKLPVPPKTFSSRAGQAPASLIIFLKALPPGAIYGYFDRLKLKQGNPFICLLYTSPSPRDGLLSRM